MKVCQNFTTGAHPESFHFISHSHTLLQIQTKSAQEVSKSKLCVYFLPPYLLDSNIGLSFFTFLFP